MRPPPDAIAVLEEITRPASVGDGWRNGWLGASGRGKTSANRWLVDYVLSTHKADLVLTHDEKSFHRAEYAGVGKHVYRTNPAHLRAQPDAAGANHVIFRGGALTRSMSDGCEPDDVARCAQEIVQFANGRVLCNIDELADATNGGQAWRRDPGGESRIAQIFRKGRGMGLSITWTTQVPQSLPREAFALSDTLGIFQLSGREVAYLLDKRVITDSTARVLPTLGVGQFVLVNRDTTDSDPRVFSFPPYPVTQ